MTTKEEQREILKRLKEPFAPEDHQERVLKGGGNWFFISWQKIRERLDEVCPDWEIEYTDPLFIDAYCVIRCTLTIAGIKRSAPGNGEIVNKRGTPIENATADAFKNAAEAFGVCRYLDEQSKEAREFTIRYLHSKGDGRAKKRAIENGYLSDGARSGSPPSNGSLPSKPASKPSQAQSSAPKPAAPASNDNGRRIMRVCELLEIESTEAYKSAAPVLGLNKPSKELTSVECSRVIDEILSQWGLHQKCFKAIPHARNAFAQLMEQPEVESNIESVVAAWQAECDRRILERSQDATVTTSW